MHLIWKICFLYFRDCEKYKPREINLNSQSEAQSSYENIIAQATGYFNKKIITR